MYIRQTRVMYRHLQFYKKISLRAYHSEGDCYSTVCCYLANVTRSHTRHRVTKQSNSGLEADWANRITITRITRRILVCHYGYPVNGRCDIYHLLMLACFDVKVKGEARIHVTVNSNGRTLPPTGGLVPIIKVIGLVVLLAERLVHVDVSAIQEHCLQKTWIKTCHVSLPCSWNGACCSTATGNEVEQQRENNEHSLNVHMTTSRTFSK